MFDFKEHEMLKAQLESFSSRVAEVTEEEEITSVDCDLFKALGFKLLDPEFLVSLSVEPPTHWSELFLSMEKFGIKNSQLILFPELDCFLSMCEGSNCYFLLKSLYYVTPTFDVTKYSGGFVQKLASCMKFTRDSLTLNFFEFYRLPGEEEFFPLLKIVAEHSSHLQLKRLSISNFQSENEIFDLIYDIIEIHRYSLVEFTLKNIFSTAPHCFHRLKKRLHLPNLEKYVILNCNLRVQKRLSIGTKLRWIEGDRDFTPALLKNREKVVFYEKYQGFAHSNRPFLNFLQTHKDLECSNVYYPNEYESMLEIAAAFKAQKNLKKFTYFDEPIENFIGSSILESVTIKSNNFFGPNCAFMKTLKNLVHLQIQTKFTPSNEFYQLLEQDTLESLLIADCELDFGHNERLYNTLGRLKKLRILKASNKYIKNPVLSESIEIFAFQIKQGSRERMWQNIVFRDYPSVTFPKGPGVKFLIIKCDAVSRMGFDFDFIDFYPKLIRAKGYCCSLTRNSKYEVDTSSRFLCEGLPEEF